MDTPKSKWLFQKGIVESGATKTMGETFITSKVSRRVTELTLKNPGISKNEIEKLQTVPFDTMDAASDKALQQAGEEFQIPRHLGSGYGLMWEPVIDGVFLSEQPPRMTGSLDIPLLIGSNRTEWENFSDIVNVAVTQYDNLNNWSDEKVERGPDRKYGAKRGSG